MSRAALVILIATWASIVCKAGPAEQTAADDREITNTGAEDWQKHWRVSLDRLQRTSRWKVDSELQLSPAEAVKKARAYVRSQGLEDGLPLTTLNLRHVNETPPDCFAYELQFGDSLKDGIVVVLLDGSIVTPVTARPPPNRTAEFTPFDEPIVNIMKQAQAVYIFPVKTKEATRPDNKDLRLLDAEARQALVFVLGNQANWHHGLMTIGLDRYYPGSIGFLFRKQDNELTLFVNSDGPGGCAVEGTFGGKDFFGFLNECAQPALEAWEQRYASTETSK